MSTYKSGEEKLESSMSSNGAPLTKSVTIDADLFEKLYLSPKNDVAGELRKTFGNPTPTGLLGFCVGLLPISCVLMQWGGSGGGGVATTAATIWFGGVLLIIAGILEWILGNTFPSTVFLGYGAHFLVYGTNFIPSFNAVAAFNTDGTQVQTPTFQASFAYYPVAMCLLSFVFLLCSTRTNVVFFLIFVFATTGFGTVAGAFYKLAAGQASQGITLLKVTGGLFFVADILGWYILTAVLLAIMDLPSPPIGDLSTVVKGQSEKAAAKAQRHEA